MFCSYKNIYRELEQNIKTADAVEDLRWFRANQGPGMSMNWPQFEVRSQDLNPRIVLSIFSSLPFVIFLSGVILSFRLPTQNFFVLQVIVVFFSQFSLGSSHPTTFGGDYVEHLLKEKMGKPENYSDFF